MAAFVQLNVSGVVYGKVTTLLDRSVQVVVHNYNLHLSGIESLPASLKDKCLYLMSKRGWLNDSNIGKFVHEKVKILDLQDSDVSDTGLQSVCKCTQLRKLDLNATKQSRTNITSDGMVQVAQSCKYLQTVYLRRCLNITDVAIVTLSQCCPQLRLLNLGGCRLITDVALTALGENSKFLKSLNISNTKVTNSGILRLVSGPCARCLTEVHINGCDLLSDEAVEAVLQMCPRISILLLHGCPNITEQSRQALGDHTLEGGAPMKQVTWTIY